MQSEEYKSNPVLEWAKEGPFARRRRELRMEMIGKIAGACVLVLGIIIGILVTGAIVSLHMIKAQEIHECNEWKDDAQNVKGFYVLQFQNDQCVSHGIIIGAPIHPNQ